MQPLFFRRNFERRADVFPASLSSASIAQEAFKLQELTLILSHYLPVILGGVLLLLVVLTAVVIYLSIRTSDMKRDLEVNAETAKALAAQAAGTTLERIEAALIRRALVRADFVQAKAAELLGISKSLMQYKLKKYSITGH